MLILGLGRRTLLCNMLKLMRCNKWANPPKACPLWQKYKSFRQAWRSLCLSQRQAGSSQRVSISLWETQRIWLIVRDMCPGSSPRGTGGQRGGRERGESDVCEQSLTMCATLTEKHLVRIRCFVQNVYMCTRIMGVSLFIYQQSQTV